MPIKRVQAAEDMAVDFIFDTNAIRNLASISVENWERVADSWQLASLRTAWTPANLGEVMGTNLNRKSGFSLTDVRELQLAVRRFDRLAQGKIAPTDRALVRRAILDCARIETTADQPRAEIWREAIELFLDINDLNQIEAVRRDSVLSVRITDEPGGREITFDVPRSFADHARLNCIAMRQRLGLSDPVPREELVKNVIADLPRNFRATAAELGVAERISGAQLPSGEDVGRSPFIVHMLCANTYYHQYAMGQKSKHRESDGIDIALTTYLADYSWMLVTDDVDLTKLVRYVMADAGRVCSLGEFLRPLSGET